MLPLLAAFLAASASGSILEAASPWWERITVTVDGKGEQQSCLYQSSLSPTGPRECDDEMAASMRDSSIQAQEGAFSKVTFERRFSPGGKLDSGRLQPGDKLLAQQVMFLTIADDGSIASCKLLATSGDRPLTYGCKQAQKEQFRVPASAQPGTARQAFMTIIAYGHQEQIA